MLLLAMIFWKHSSPTVRRRKTSKLRSIWKHSDQPALLQNGSQKVFLILYNQLKSLLCLYKYPMDWSHCHWNIIFPGILRRFGGWLLRNRACLIVSQNHTLQHFFFIPKIECDGLGAISNDLRSWLLRNSFFEISKNFRSQIFWDLTFLRSQVFEISGFWDPRFFEISHFFDKWRILRSSSFRDIK